MDTVNVEQIENELIKYVNCNGEILSIFGELKFTNSNRIGQGGNGLVFLAKLNEETLW